MRPSHLNRSSQAEALIGGASSLGYFDIPAQLMASRMNALEPELVPRWESQWSRGGLFGPGVPPHNLARIINAQDPAGASDAGRKDFPRSQPGMGSSPRQRAAFLRDVTNTPAFVLVQSPTALDSAVTSPSLPFVAPEAPVVSKRLVARRAQKKRSIRWRHWKDSQPVWLGLYFAFNLCLTLYNKGVLVRFPFPYTLTAVHAFFGTVGGYVLKQRDIYIPAQLNARSYAVLVAFSVLYSVNIAVSNLSLHLVTIPFHQVLRATTPIFTTILSSALLGTRFTNIKIAALLLITLGVALATYGDYYFTTLGFILTLLGTFLASLKTIYTNILQSSSIPASRVKMRPRFRTFASFVPPRLNLHPLDLLTRMSPLAFIQCVLYAFMSGEFSRIRNVAVADSAAKSSLSYLLLLLGNGCIAFGLNVVSFTANGKVGPLNMTVAANVKQVLTILLAVAIFDLTITRTNATGILIAIAGGTWYAWVEHEEKAARVVEKTSIAR